MSPLLQILMDATDAPLAPTEEEQALRAEIKTCEDLIREKFSFEFLDKYTSLCGRKNALENEACFERGVQVCAQLFSEMLSRYSS